MPAPVLPHVQPVASVQRSLTAAGGPAAEVQTLAELVGNSANQLGASRDWRVISQLPRSMAHDVSDEERGRFKLRSVDNACAAAAHSGVAGIVAALQPQLHDIGQQLAAHGQQLDLIGQQLAAQGQQLQTLTDEMQQTRAQVCCSASARLHQ
jgi:hypothetical protein